MRKYFKIVCVDELVKIRRRSVDGRANLTIDMELELSRQRKIGPDGRAAVVDFIFEEATAVLPNNDEA